MSTEFNQETLEQEPIPAEDSMSTSPLMEIPVLDDFMAQVETVRPPLAAPDYKERFDAVDFWLDRSNDAQSREFVVPEQWEGNLKYDRLARDMAKNKKEAIFTEESSRILQEHFKDRPEDFQRFKKQRQVAGRNPAGYTPEFFPLVKRLNDLRSEAKIPEGTTNIAGQIQTSNNRSIGDFSLNYSSDGNYDSAIVHFKKFGIKGEDTGTWSGDVIHFPKNFDPVQQTLESAIKRKDQILEAIGSIPDADPSSSEYQAQDNATNSVTDSLFKELEEKESLIESLQKKDPAAIEAAKLEGVNVFINEHVASKIESGDPKYKGVGMSTGESIKASLLYNNLERLGVNLNQGALNIGLGVTDFVRYNQFHPLTTNLEAGAKAVATGVASVLQKQLDATNEIGREVDARGTFSRLGTHSPKLAESYEKITNAVGQGARIAGVFAAGAPVGLSSTFLEVSGAKIAELEQREAELRAKGDIESADFLKANKRTLSYRSAIWEMVPEMMFPGHAAFRAVSPKEAIMGAGKSFVKDAAGESVEGGITNVLGATDEYLTGTINQDQYYEKLLETPEAAILEGIGVFAPAGARAVITGMSRGSAARVAKRTADMDKATAERQQRQAEVEARTKAEAAFDGTASTGDVNYQGSVTETPQPQAEFSRGPKNTSARTTEGVAAAVNKDAEEMINQATAPAPLTDKDRSDMQGSMDAQAKIAEVILNEAEPVGDTPAADIVVDQAVIVVPEGRTEQDKRETRAYLEVIKDSAMSRMREYGISGSSIAGNFPRNPGDGLPQGANFVIAYPEGDKPVFPEGDEAREIQKRIEQGKAKDPQDAIDQLLVEGWKIYSKTPFNDSPAMLHVARNNIVVGDARGQTILMSQNDLVKAIENGEIDPAKNYFWFEQNADMNQDQVDVFEKLNAAIPPDNWAMPKVSGITSRSTQGIPQQSKANDQFYLKDTGFALDTVTIGGKSVGVKETETGSVTEGYTGLDDVFESAGLKTQLREGVIATPDPSDYSKDIYNFTTIKANFLDRADHPKLVKALNERFGEKNWILKPDNQARRAGIIRSWNPGDVTEAGEFVSDIPVDPDYFYIAQEKAQGITMSARVDAKVSANGELQIVPNGIKMHYFTKDQFAEDGTLKEEEFGSGWRVHGDEIVPLKFRDALSGFFQSLKGTPYTAVPGSVYGFDLVLTKNGIRVMESNVATEEGWSGGLSQYAKTFSGLAATTKGMVSPETLAAASGYFKMTGSNAIADKLMDLAVEQLGATPEQVPELQDLYNKRVLFNPMQLHREIKRGEKAFIATLNLSRIDNRKYNDVSKLPAPTVDQVLTEIHESDSPSIPMYTKALAKALRDQARKSRSAGSGVKIFLSSSNSYFTKEIGGTGGYITVTGDAVEDLIHEVIHGLTDAKLPQLLSVYTLPGITGNEYKQVLLNYMNDPAGNPLLKEVINDYMNAIKAMGYADSVFNDKPLKTGQEYIKDRQPYLYGLSSLDEFITNALTNPQFIRNLASIPDTTTRSYFRRLLDALMQWFKSELLYIGAPEHNAWNKTFHDIMMFIASDDIPGNEWEVNATIVAATESYTDLFTDRMVNPYGKSNQEKFVYDRLQWRSSPEFEKMKHDFEVGNQAKIFNLTLDKKGHVNAPSFFAKLKGANMHPFEKQTIENLAIKHTADNGKVDAVAVANEFTSLSGIQINPISVTDGEVPLVVSEWSQIAHQIETLGLRASITRMTGLRSEIFTVTARQLGGLNYSIQSNGETSGFKNIDDALEERIHIFLTDLTSSGYEMIKGADDTLSLTSATGMYGVNPYHSSVLTGSSSMANGERISWSGDISINFTNEISKRDLVGIHHENHFGVNQHSFIRGSLHEFSPGAIMHDGSKATGKEKVFQIWEVQSDQVNLLNQRVKELETYIRQYQTGIEENSVLNLNESSEVVRYQSRRNIIWLLDRISNIPSNQDSVLIKKFRDFAISLDGKELQQDDFDKARKLIDEYNRSITELSSWKSVSLNAAFIHAQRLGATHISLLDGNSVAAMEGHQGLSGELRERIIKGVKKNYDGDYIDVLKTLTGKLPKFYTIKESNDTTTPFKSVMNGKVSFNLFPIDHIYTQPRLSENNSVTEDNRPPVIFRSGYPEDLTSRPYGSKRVQKGFDGKPAFELYEILMPGTYWHGTTIEMPPGSTHDEIMAKINDKYKKAGQTPPVKMSASKNSLPSKVKIGSFKINTKFLNEADQQNLQELRNRLAKGEKIPSVMLEEQLIDYRNKAERGEFNILAQAYPEAFSSKNKEWTGFTSLAAAENTLADWLFANPGKQSEGELFGDTPARRKKRKKIVRSFTGWVDKMIDMMKADELQTFFTHPPEVQRIVDKSLDFVLANYDASSLTDRQITALNLAMKTFLESDGYNVRGFAQLASQIQVSENLAKLEEVRAKLAEAGVENPWGDPITDFRRAFVGDSRTGSSLADYALEVTAIYNRPETRRVWSDLFAGYKAGLDHYKASYQDMDRLYTERIKKQGKTTRLNDTRIGIALVVTQYEQNEDPAPQLLKAVGEVAESIRRKLSSKNERFREDGEIEKVAFDMLVAPLVPALQSGMKYDKFIAAIENGLTEQEFNLLRIARDPGVLFYNQLDAINQVARGKPIQNWKNYAKRVQIPLNKDNPTEHWGESAIQNPGSILQPREGLGKNAVFSFNWRSNFDYQLDETAYELSTGVERVMLFDTMRSSGFEGIMDGNDSSKSRSFRLREQVGGVHSNIKNRELRFDTLLGGALQIAQASIAMKLATIRAPFNQMIPMLTYGLNNSKTLGLTLYNRLVPENKAKSDAFIKKHNRDLLNRLRQWDTFIDRFNISDRKKKSGIKTGAASVTESLGVIGDQMARAISVGVTEAVMLPITVTNGVSEVFAARTVFFALYAQQMMARKLINEVDDLYIGKEIPYDKEAMAQAELEFDSFVMSPISPEFRSEASQRNSNGKVISQIFFQGLLRTATQQSLKSITAARDLAEAVRLHHKNPTAISKSYLKSAAIEVEKQLLNIGIYYGIGYAIHNTLGNMMASTFFAIAAHIGDDDDEREKWMRRMRALERINKDSQKQFQMQQLGTDLIYAMFPYMPGIMHSNPGREVFNTALGTIFIGRDTAEGYELQLKQLREQRDNYQSIIDKQAYINGKRMISEPEYNRLLSALEMLEHSIAKVEEERDFKNNFVKNAAASFAKSMTPLPDGNKIIRTGEDIGTAFTPDWISEMFLSKGEKARMTKRELEKVRIGYEWWAFSAFFNASGPSQKAAREMTKEYADQKVEKRIKMEEFVDEKERMLKLK
jgi:hypothetical protein